MTRKTPLPSTLLRELREVRLEEPGLEQQLDDEQDQPTPQ
jgi:hypothetical protein